MVYWERLGGAVMVPVPVVLVVLFVVHPVLLVSDWSVVTVLLVSKTTREMCIN